ncbi:MAG: hypothetical protein ABIY55_09250, partial [Kofleriaceae bacterium]
AKAQLASLLSSRIETDRQVLAAAFADPAPLDEIPLLLLTGDGLTELGDRLRTAAPLYDLACRVRGSCSLAEANEATQLIRLIGALPSDAALGDALTAATGVRAAWRDLFTALRARRGALETALRKATGRSTATLDELYLPSPIAAAAGLAERVTTSLAMWTSYASHGVLLPRDSTLLKTSLVDTKVVSTLQSFVEARGTLRTQREDFQRTRGDFAKTIVDRIANGQFQVRVDNEIAASRLEYDNLGRDLDGLTASQDHAEHEVGKFLATYVERASNPGWLPDYPIQGHPVFLPVAATAARGSGTLATDVTAVALRDPAAPAQPWHLDVDKGDVLTFDVTGSWSPTCALRSTTLVGPDSTSGFSDPSHLQIGPEGFSISWQNNTFVAADHISSDFSSQTATTSICGSVSANLLTVTAGTVPIGSMSVTASTCRQWQTGHSDTDTSTDGSRFQSSANFAGGLRVPGTPFPSLPGGALLLVEVITREDGGTNIRDVHVVRPHASYMIPENTRIYLVVNDKAGCQGVDTSALSVSYTRGQSTAPAAYTLAQAMASILAQLRTQKASYVAQGSVSASDLSALQRGAYDQLGAACSCNLSAFPEEVRGMFDAWLSAELASIERQVRIVAAERALDSLVLRLKALRDDLAGAQSASRLLSLMTYWQLSHLAYPQLRSYADPVLDGINANLMPLMRILYPQALVAVQQSAGSSITNLRTFDWMLPYDEQINLVEVLADAIKQKIDDARNGGGQSVAPLVVVFPKPSGTVPNVPGSVTAPPERLGAVWQTCASGTGVCLRRKPTFTITPEDVYGRPLVGLGCGEAAPVIQTFAVVTVNSGGSGNDNWNTNPRRADISRAADMLFPTENGILGFRTDGVTGVLAPSRVRVLASADSGVGATFDEFVRRPGSDLHGVSPFGSFTVDLGDAVTTSAPLSASTALVAYFDLQTRTATGPLAGLGVCAQPLAPGAGGAPPGGSGSPPTCPGPPEDPSSVTCPPSTSVH